MQLKGKMPFKTMDEDLNLIKFVVQEEITYRSAEERDYENRKRNVVIYRVPERKTDNVSFLTNFLN